MDTPHGRRRVRNINHIKENDDPPLPLAMAPKGVPTLCDWKAKEYHSVDNVTGLIDMGGECSI